MSNKERLEKYLLKEKTFLLDDINNGKTIMISGAWGAGKTHFWKEEIEKEQKKIQKDGEEVDKYTTEEYNEGLHAKLKDKACVYVSLYGKASIESIELDVYMKAYQNIVGDADFVSKTCSVFTNVGKNLGNMAHKGAGGAFSWIESLVDKDKFDKAGKYIENGGVICFDDFERKSKDIDLNDLFGFISQLALEYQCKVIIILNSDVFKGKEAEIFNNVKEKTVNKFLYFEPTIKELFDSIAKNEKYRPLDNYKDGILKAIEETEELNARIYMQVLDNCLEWLIVKKNLDVNITRVLTLGTFNFVLNHMVLEWIDKFGDISSSILDIPYKLSHVMRRGGMSDKSSLWSNYEDIDDLNQKIVFAEKPSTSEKEFLLAFSNNNEEKLKALWKYGYKLHYVQDVEEETYNEIAQFIKSGILI